MEARALVDKIVHENEENHELINKHFEERWQEVISNKIQLDGNPSEEAILFAKSVFMYGCNVGWNDCYLFHEDLIQKGLNQQ